MKDQNKASRIHNNCVISIALCLACSKLLRNIDKDLINAMTEEIVAVIDKLEIPKKGKKIAHKTTPKYD